METVVLTSLPYDDRTFDLFDFNPAVHPVPAWIWNSLYGPFLSYNVLIALLAHLSSLLLLNVVNLESCPRPIQSRYMAHESLRVLTFNVWALKWISKNRVERLQAIAELLKDSDYDIICFQELWTGYDLIKRTLCRQFPHSKYWRTAVVGSGLAIFSKFTILSSHVYPYSLNGSPAELGGDWFAGKACVSTLLWHPILGETDINKVSCKGRGGGT